MAESRTNASLYSRHPEKPKSPVGGMLHFRRSKSSYGWEGKQLERQKVAECLWPWLHWLEWLDTVFSATLGEDCLAELRRLGRGNSHDTHWQVELLALHMAALT